jgi:hypothetical protein
MVLTNTLNLIQEYGPALHDGSITDDQLKALETHFKAVGGYRDVNTTPYSDAHHKTDEAMGDFVVAIGPHIPQVILHTLVDRLIKNTNADPKQNMLFRGSKLEKYFLAYEKMTDSTSAQQHYKADGAIYKFFQNTTDDKNAVKRQADLTSSMTRMSEVEMQMIQKNQKQEQNLIDFALDAHDDPYKKACLEQRHLLFKALDAALQETPPSITQAMADNIKQQSDKALLGTLSPNTYNNLINIADNREVSQNLESTTGIGDLMRALLNYISHLFSSDEQESAPVQISDDTIDAMQDFKKTLQDTHKPEDPETPDENTPLNPTQSNQ